MSPVVIAPGCHCAERQRRSNPQEQDCRVAIAARNDNEGFVWSCQASWEKLVSRLYDLRYWLRLKRLLVEEDPRTDVSCPPSR
jgi:hypothetical protein